ncbi:MAG: hypothetical protein IPN98_05025 [Propionivibrio sp.]|nr:hypothetical protein [Propionivibrio sp.]
MTRVTNHWLLHWRFRPRNIWRAPQRTLEVLAERIVASEAGQQMPLTPLLDALVESSDFFEVICVVDRKGESSISVCSYGQEPK